MSVRDSGSDELLPNKMAREPVLLNVYDMYKINEFTSNIGLGVFHSGKYNKDKLTMSVFFYLFAMIFRSRDLWN